MTRRTRPCNMICWRTSINGERSATFSVNQSKFRRLTLLIPASASSPPSYLLLTANPSLGKKERTQNVKKAPRQIDLSVTNGAHIREPRAKRHRLSPDRHAIHRMRRFHVAARRLPWMRKHSHTRPEAGVSELCANLARLAQ